MEDHFRIRTIRKVDKDRTVSLRGRIYEAPVELVGKMATLLYHENDPARIEIFFNNTSFGMLVPLDMHINYKVKRHHFTMLEMISGEAVKYEGGSSSARRRMMDEHHYFGCIREPFSSDIRVEDLYQTPALNATTERILYAVHLGAVSVVTGEAGSGKSTALRYASSKLHPSGYKIIPVIASTGSMVEMLRQICIGLDIAHTIMSISKLMKMIRDVVIETAQKKQVPVLVIDEANLMRFEVFAELHTLCQFDMDSKPLLPLILAGQNNLLDKLMYHTSRPLASRVIGRSHLEGLAQKDMAGYLKHHLEIAGIKDQLFSDEAILAIHQGSGGLLRRANFLAKGALIAAAAEKCRMAAAEHVRMATTEII